MSSAFALEGTIGVNLHSLESGMAKAHGLVNNFGSSVAGAGLAMTKAFAVATIAGVTAVGAGLGYAVKQGADFEKTMSGIAAVSGATAAEMKTLSALALKLGADTSFSATEAGQGIEELVKAGVSLADVMSGGAKASLDLAAAGAISVADAATIASNAMNQFGLHGKDMAHVANVIAGAANASAIDVGQFKFSLAQAGAVAATTGFSFDDLATAIAVMGQAGVVGSDAGTSLKTMMMALQPGTKAQKQLFAELGLTLKDGSNAFFDATGKVKGMADVAQILQTSMKGMTDQQRLAALETIFGSDAMRAGAIISKAGAAGFNEMAAAMGKVTAESVANTRLDNLSGSIEKLTGSLSTAAITVGLAFIPSIRAVVDAATETLNAWMPAITAFSEQIPAAMETVVAEISGPFTTALTWLTVTGWPMLQTAMSGVWTFMTGTFFPALSTLWTWLSATLPVALTWLSTTGWPATQIAMAAVAGWVVASLIPTLSGLWDWLSPKLQAALGWLTTTGWPAFYGAAAVVIGWLGTTGVPGLETLWNWLSPKLSAAFTWLSDTGWPNFQKAAATVWAWIQNPLLPTLSTLWDWLSPKLNAALTWLTATGWPKLQEAATAVWSWLKSSLFPTLSEWYDWFQARLSPIFSWFIDYGWPTLQKAGQAVWAWLTGTLFPALSEWWDWFQARLSPIFTWFTTTGWPALQAAGSVVWTWLTGTLFPALSGWYDWFQARLSPIFSWFIDYGWPTLQKAGQAVWAWLTGTLFPVLSEWWLWLSDKLWSSFSWFIDYGWPKILEGAKSYGDYISGNLLKRLGELNAELAKTDNAESWVTIFENLGKFGKYLIENVDLGGWFSKVGSGAGNASGEIGYIAQAIAWISRTLAKWSAFLPGASAPAPEATPQRPAGGAGGAGGGSSSLPSMPTRSTGAGPGVIPTQPPTSIQPALTPVTPVVTAPIDNSSRASFVKTGFAAMLQAAGGSRDLAEMMLAAAISENGDVGKGGSFIGNNFFGIKGTGPAGSLWADTWEMVNGQRVAQKAQFAAYHTPVEGFGGFMDFLKRNSRYANALEAFGRSGNATQLFRDINSAGYATDPGWAVTVSSIRANQVAPITAGLAQGGIVSARFGGTMAILGEGGRDEAVTPLPPGWRTRTGNVGSMQTIRIVIEKPSGREAEEIVVEGYDLAVRRGRLPAIQR